MDILNIMDIFSCLYLTYNSLTSTVQENASSSEVRLEFGAISCAGVLTSGAIDDRERPSPHTESLRCDDL
jgi:hypothetical protein